MREIVHIQAGQCGNQIGAKVSMVKGAVAVNLKRILRFRQRKVLRAASFTAYLPPSNSPVTPLPIFGHKSAASVNLLLHFLSIKFTCCEF